MVSSLEAFSSHSVIICTAVHVVPRSYRHGDEVNSDLIRQ